METQTIAAVQAIDFSVLALFLRATFIVKLVLMALMASSFWSWAIIIQKFINFRIAKRDAARFEQAFLSGESLDKLFDEISDQPRGASEKTFCAGMKEFRLSGRMRRSERTLMLGVQARVERAMDVAIVRETERLSRGLTFLATVGSTAPFVGLFGTVWGIKNAFQEIAAQQSTNLAVVAPGIAEALVATALGLFAAIPAVIFYNKLSADSYGIAAGLDRLADQFATMLSRELDS